MSDPVTAAVYRTMNAGFVQEMYEQYLREPASVDPEWRALFENGGRGLEPVAGAVPQQVKSPTLKVEGREAPAPAMAGAAQPMKGAAARLVANMEQSLGVPTATGFRDVPALTLDERRKALNASLAPKKISYTHLIAYALVQAAKQFPVMTHAFASIEGAPHRIVPDGISLGLAVDVEKKDGSRALVVPVIKRADAMDFGAFHAAYESLVARARAGQLLPDDYKGATMTLTNPGTIGTVASVPRLMSGQGSIIATGAIRDGGGPRIMTISSTYDHRVIQGAESGMFLRLVDQLLQGEQGFYEGIFRGAGASERMSGEPETVESSAPALPRSHAPAPLTVDLKSVAASMALVRAHRLHGVSLAHLDPLGAEPPGDPACEPGHLGLTQEVMARVPADVLRVYVPGATMAEVFPALRAVYCGTIAYEFEHIASHDERVWLRQQVETGANRRPLPAAEKRKLLGRLTAVDALERFLHKTYLGQKRFSIEGLDVAVPMLDLIVEIAGERGAHDVVIGMAHRGRLNVLAHVVNLPYETILNEFESHGAGGAMKPERGTGDVKYHHGAEGSFETPSGRRVTVTLAPNPSHLEAVNPVVEGRTRAEQTQRARREASHDDELALPVLLHGDAAFTGQGIVAETFNLARLEGYATGGTVHVITDNQIGFTTDPEDSRSTDYASDLAKGFDAPIVHVNADDPEACLTAVRLAMAYRERYHNDVVIDVVGYRRWGHNEGDEPSYTQPLLYEKIRQHPTARQVYARQLAGEGVMTAAEADKLADGAYQRLAEAQAAVKRRLASEAPHQEPRHTGAFAAVSEPGTAVDRARLLELNDQLLAVPAGFTVNPKLKKQLDRRRETVGPEGGMEWAHAEALAYASLLAEGVPVRLSGQDAERGTFSQRHLALHDAKDGRRWAPIQNLAAAKASVELFNSPLSEYACLGFEYGYAVAAPEALVLWEAQFGDFANGAEIIVDQFIFAGLAKWGQTSRLTLLLPHGYEGQGPEHSSARIERFAALGAEGNIRVANCSTPAQYFHLLRRQALHEELRPLVVFTPKSLLRLPAATSHLDELSSGAFQPVLDDPAASQRRAQVTRLLLCSGKVYYDLLASPEREQAAHAAIGRVELLYPLPRAELAELLARYPGLKEIVWVQEEPSNMGARKFITPELRRLAPSGVQVLEVSRPERASPAEGYPAAHAAEQARIVREALS
ncbi:MAG: multifunctional oxoglutarate decarboxylase/oxoglutarate dehydrogenase thiamine pyrophosphate-binding subunit/dihydrolipoyllysine-residue succinyltransferase subunit [Gemmatimonadales bacterium]